MPTLGDLPPALLLAVAVSLGLVFGSFLNVVIHRVPLGQSVVAPGSRCPGCGTPIHAWNNLPVLSWLLLRGKASCCGVRISPRYPLVEAMGGLLAWAVVEAVLSGLPLETPWYRVLGLFAVHLTLGLGLIAAAFIDLEHLYLPDVFTLGGTALGLASVPLRPEANWVDSLVGAALGFVIVWLPFDLLYRLVRGRTGMGLGDAKLVMLAGAWFGWQGAVFALLAGAMQGTLTLIALLVAQGKIEEPIAVQNERAAAAAELEAAEGEERERLAAEFAKDPVLAEPPPRGLGEMRFAFGPFLVLAILEFQLLGPWLLSNWLSPEFLE